MTRVHEDETWYVDPEDPHELLGTHANCEGYPVATFAGTAIAHERAKLAAAAPEMACALLQLEFGCYGYSSNRADSCPGCQGDKRSGHSDTCGFHEMLKRLGIAS